ncbi:MAG: acetyl-CoA carboxylase biotin carboxyl carrier protein subunit [Oscillospiraceae bacterium]|nr:acetyl-CoA carboxylase biotin carboxyl carrier protein subunit [Oscillospiraceae bacterium]
MAQDAKNHIAKIRQLAELLEASSLASLTYEDADFKLALSKNAPQAAGAPPAEPPEQSAPQAAAANRVTVTAPVVGTAYRARGPGLPPLVNAGGRVKRGDALCVVEAMKMFSDIESPCDGTVAEIAFEDGALAEYGAVLVILETGE